MKYTESKPVIDPNRQLKEQLAADLAKDLVDGKINTAQVLSITLQIWLLEHTDDKGKLSLPTRKPR